MALDINAFRAAAQRMQHRTADVPVPELAALLPDADPATLVVTVRGLTHHEMARAHEAADAGTLDRLKHLVAALAENRLHRRPLTITLELTRRCNAHTDQGLGFGGAPIFYGNFAKAFRESKDHEGNPFWYQGLVFNEFVSALDGKQQEKILVGREPRAESPATVIQRRKTDLPGLSGADLSGIKGGELALASTEIVPREGEVIGWKKCRSNVLVKVRVPPTAKRSNATGRKCRAECVETLEVVGADVGVSLHDGKTEYRVGATTTANGWGADRMVECDKGIHFWLTKEEAAAWTG